MCYRQNKHFGELWKTHLSSKSIFLFVKKRNTFRIVIENFTTTILGSKTREDRVEGIKFIHLFRRKFTGAQTTYTHSSPYLDSDYSNYGKIGRRTAARINFRSRRYAFSHVHRGQNCNVTFIRHLSVSAVSVLFPWKFHIGEGEDNIREIIAIREKLSKIRISRSVDAE